jgi:hypothetical protein
MSATDMVVFNTQLKQATVERLTQMSDAFNAASNGSIILSNAGNMGDFLEWSYFKNLGSAIRDVDIYGANGTVSTTPVSQGQINTVKAHTAFGPILFQPKQFRLIQENPDEALRVISTSLAQAMLQDQLNKALFCGTAAIGEVAELNQAGAAITQVELNNTHALFGDRSMELTTQVMTGAAYHQLIGNALENGNELFSEGTVTVVDILGKRSIITDSPALVDGTDQKVLCLTPNSLTVEPNGDFDSNVQTNNGKAIIERTYQSEWSDNLGVKGYAWDITVKSPDTSALGTGANWTKEWEDKNTAGVLLTAPLVAAP